ncbi:HAD-IIIC family phosphatase [Yinghuangia sp. ASG 101]|uniref:HAD-IIIC family phosphatase n=1 Tax=Yinghuangia sp. ASG 101 TaxID=2896848 RepID=UPI001E46ABCB|nr:HAD-IIIC family phosphatase [Yinghuangia sp. ASG 101]UGQ12417.1 HAD-IIIC family phosphatase [Yinghuangia sp. ASG 101]
MSGTDQAETGECRDTTPGADDADGAAEGTASEGTAYERGAVRADRAGRGTAGDDPPDPAPDRTGGDAGGAGAADAGDRRAAPSPRPSAAGANNPDTAHPAPTPHSSAAEANNADTAHPAPTSRPPAAGANDAGDPPATPSPHPPAVAHQPPEDIRTLHRAGRIAADYPRVRRLLAGLDAAGLAHAGRLLATVAADDILAAHPDTPTVGVAITGHSTLSALPPAVTAEFARHGLLARTRLTDFDSWVFALSDPASPLHSDNPDLVLCVLDPHIVLDELPVPWRADDAEAVLRAKTALIGRLVARFVENASGTLVLNTLPLPRGATAQLIDHRSRARLGAAWRDANAALLRLAEKHPRILVVDLDPHLADGVAATEPRLSCYAKAHLSAELLAAYARDIGHIACLTKGRTRKALVVDLDETLWGGILGEDGPDGVEVGIGGGHRAEAFTAFQRVVKQIGAQGVLLAAVSKNDPEPVEAMLTRHPGMTLTADDFVRVTANWRPKHENLLDLAKALNLGVDSFVFVDDSPYERGLVRHELPDVAVVDIDREPALHVSALLADGWFDTVALTAEDLGRGALYRDELARADFLHSFDSLDDYLGELGVTVSVSAVRDRDVARIAQITQRTNQFNLTTERLQQADVLDRLDDPAHLVLAIRAADRFGDNGLVGAVFTRRTEDGVHIDNFLLSCRVFSRGIEQTVLASLLRYAKNTGSAAVTGAYRSSAKNGNVSGFYARNGFSAVDHTDDTATRLWRHDLADIAEQPQHVSATADFARAPRPDPRDTR